MQVAAAPVAGVDTRDRRHSGVRDHVAPDAVPVLDHALPPRQHRTAAEVLNAEVGGHAIRERLLPNRGAEVVDDQRTGLRAGSVVGREQDHARGDGSRRGQDLQRRDAQVGTADERGHDGIADAVIALSAAAPRRTRCEASSAIAATDAPPTDKSWRRVSRCAAGRYTHGR